jgi:hypothetical protein
MTNDTEQPNIRESDLGTTFTAQQIKEQAHVLYGGVAWPGKRPGFAVVLALGKEKRFVGNSAFDFDNSDIYVLDEIEAADTRELVHRCAGLNAKYTPARWVGGHRNNAADRFINELNARQAPPVDAYEERPSFSVGWTQLLELERPYEYLLPSLKALLDKDRKRLFLKGSRVTQYLGEIKPDEIPFLEWGEYPAIEALGLTVYELRYWRPAPPKRWHERDRNRPRRMFIK